MFWMAPVGDAGRIDCPRQFCPPGTAKQAPKCQVCDLKSAITMRGRGKNTKEWGGGEKIFNENNARAGLPL